MDKFERRAMFDRLIDLRTIRRLSGDDERVIAGDGWTPNTDALDPVGAAVRDGIVKMQANHAMRDEAYAAAQERWYDQRPKDWPA